MAVLPEVLRILRQRAGLRSLRSAARRVQENTGTVLGPSTLSEWERGAAHPSLESLVVFLLGLGYDFVDFHGALEEALALRQAGEEKAPVQVDERAEGLATRLREDSPLRHRLQMILRETSADAERPVQAVQELIDYLEELGEAG